MGSSNATYDELMNQLPRISAASAYEFGLRWYGMVWYGRTGMAPRQ